MTIWLTWKPSVLTSMENGQKSNEKTLQVNFHMNSSIISSGKRTMHGIVVLQQQAHDATARLILPTAMLTTSFLMSSYQVSGPQLLLFQMLRGYMSHQSTSQITLKGLEHKDNKASSCKYTLSYLCRCCGWYSGQCWDCSWLWSPGSGGRYGAGLIYRLD